MLKKEYLSSDDVMNFLKWLSDRLDHDQKTGITLHSWVANSRKAASRKEHEWSCQSLYDAYEKYFWDGAGYADTANNLELLSKNLHSAIQNSDSEKCKSACIEILKWGGVDKPNIGKQIRELSESDNKYLLPAYLKAVKEYLSKNDIDSSETSIEFEVNGNPYKYKLDIDSGTTKIFSLLHDDFIIYDSRVGSALCMLVSMCIDDREEIPEKLKFSWQDGGGKKTLRNPNRGAVAFPRIKNGKLRNEHNFHASWLLKKLLEMNPDSKFQSFEKPLRALEAALFMIGYDLQKYKPEDSLNNEVKVENTNQKNTSAMKSAGNKPTNAEKLWAQIQTKWNGEEKEVTIKELIDFAPYNSSEILRSSYNYAILTLLSDKHNFIEHVDSATKEVIDNEVKKTNRNNGIWRKHLNSKVRACK